MAYEGDTRIMAEWLDVWEPRDDGEFYIDDQQYAEDGPYESELKAAYVASARDYFGVGYVVIERYDRVPGYDFCTWERIDSRVTDDVIGG